MAGDIEWFSDDDSTPSAQFDDAVSFGTSWGEALSDLDGQMCNEPLSDSGDEGADESDEGDGDEAAHAVSAEHCDLGPGFFRVQKTRKAGGVPSSVLATKPSPVAVGARGRSYSDVVMSEKMQLPSPIAQLSDGLRPRSLSDFISTERRQLQSPMSKDEPGAYDTRFNMESRPPRSTSFAEEGSHGGSASSLYSQLSRTLSVCFASKSEM
jgi:hypothetical protein